MAEERSLKKFLSSGILQEEHPDLRVLTAIWERLQTALLPALGQLA